MEGSCSLVVFDLLTLGQPRFGNDRVADAQGGEGDTATPAPLGSGLRRNDVRLTRTHFS